MKDYTKDYIKDMIGEWKNSIYKKPSFMTDEKESRDFIVDVIMKKYGITSEDLEDINIVKSKLRDINIDEILK